MTKTKTKTKETLELYSKIGTQERRAVNRLLRAMASNNMTQTELSSICRSVSRLSAAARDNDEPKRKSGYIVYYSEQYPSERAKQPTASLGEIAKEIAKRWKALPQEKRDELNKKARAQHG
jgi:hypothetical protein